MNSTLKKITEHGIEDRMRQIAVMEAFLAGKTIQYRVNCCYGPWLDATERDLWHEDLTYRVKPEEE